MRAQLRVDATGARLTVAPDELGPVEISVAADEAGIAVHVRADRPESGELLRRHADLLQRELTEGGVASARLSFSQSGQDGPPREQPGDAALPARRGATGTETVDPAPAARRPIAPAGRLDLRL